MRKKESVWGQNKDYAAGETCWSLKLAVSHWHFEPHIYPTFSTLIFVCVCFCRSCPPGQRRARRSWKRQRRLAVCQFGRTTKFRHQNCRFVAVESKRSAELIVSLQPLLSDEADCCRSGYFSIDCFVSSLWLIIMQVLVRAWSRLVFFPLCTHSNKMWGSWDWPVGLLTCQIKYTCIVTCII